MFQFVPDPANPTFKCQCGQTRCDRVRVHKPDGSTYTTEFVLCVGCRAVFHWPGTLPSPDAGKTFATYGVKLGDEPHPATLDPEFMAQIEAAADRARKSRRSRRR